MGIFSPETQSAGLDHFARHAAGDQQALAQFIRCVKPELKSWLRNKKGIPATEVMRVINDVTLVLIEYLNEPEPIENLFGLMVEIAKNKSADHFRQRGTEQGLEKPGRKARKQFKKACDAYEKAAPDSEHRLRVALREQQYQIQRSKERHLEQRDTLADLYDNEREALQCWESGAPPVVNEEMEERTIRGHRNREGESEPANAGVLKQGALRLALRSLDDDLRDVIELRHYLLKDTILAAESIAEFLGYDCQETAERKITKAMGLPANGKGGSNLWWMGKVFYIEQADEALLLAADEYPAPDATIILANELVNALKQIAVKPPKAGRQRVEKVKGQKRVRKVKEVDWNKVCKGYEKRLDWEREEDKGRDWNENLCTEDADICRCSYHRQLRDAERCGCAQPRPVAGPESKQSLDSLKDLKEWADRDGKPVLYRPSKAETREERKQKQVEQARRKRREMSLGYGNDLSKNPDKASEAPRVAVQSQLAA